MQSIHTDKKPWYKYPHLWLVIFFPASAVVTGSLLLSIAIKTDDGVVVDDYYQKGKEINLLISRDKEAARLGLNGNAIYNPDKQRLGITLASSANAALPDKVRLQLLHATRGKIDIEQTLNSSQYGMFFHDLSAPLAPGGWIIQVSTADWRVYGRIMVPGNLASRLTPP